MLFNFVCLMVYHNLAHGSPTRGPRYSIMRPAATFVNYTYILEKLHNDLGYVHHLS